MMGHESSADLVQCHASLGRLRCLTALCLLIAYQGWACADLLEYLGENSVVIFPDNFSETEEKCARRIAHELIGKADSPDVHLLLAGAITPDERPNKVNRSRHLIAVGKIGSQFLLKEPNLSTLARPGSGKDSLYVFGFGTYTGDIGYIECVRNPYASGDRSNSSPMVIKITGTTDKGVELATYSFLNQRFINAVLLPVTPKDKSELPDGMLADSIKFPQGVATPDSGPPDVAPERIDAGGATAHFAGWTLPDESMYIAFRKFTTLPLKDGRGIAPQRIWRAKFLMPNTTGEEAEQSVYSLHRRTTENELLVLQFGDSQQARAATERIRQASPAARWKEIKVSGLPAWQARDRSIHVDDLRVNHGKGSVYMLRVANYVFLESLPSPYDKALMEKLVVYMLSGKEAQ